MEIDNAPGQGEVKKSWRFENFNLAAMEQLAKRFEIGKGEFIEEKQTKLGQEPPVIETKTIHNMGFVATGDAEALLFWQSDQNELHRLILTKERDSIGVERLSDGREAMVFMRDNKKPVGSGKHTITIRKFYREK